MKRGLALLENNGKSILENADSSFAVPSQTSDRTYEVRLLGADNRYVCTCPDFSIVRLTLVSTFMLSDYGLLSGVSYKMSQSPRSLQRMQFLAIGAVLSEL
jgi:hypothetical protein